MNKLKSQETEVLQTLLTKVQEAGQTFNEYLVYVIQKAGLDPAEYGIAPNLEDIVEIKKPALSSASSVSDAQKEKSQQQDTTV